MGFKIGDVVEYKNTNQIHKIVDVGRKGWLKLENYPMWYNPKYFTKVVFKNNIESNNLTSNVVYTDKDKPKQPKHYSYQFTTSSPDAIDWNKIAKDCKEWGVLLVEHSNKAFIIVSDKLFVKALACGINENPFKEDDQETIWVDFYTIRPISKKDIPSIKEWVNKVINAKWVNSKSTTVVVKEII